jgi:tRNA (mo5U34)-methyltransferase
MTLQSNGLHATEDHEIARRTRELAPWFHNLHLPGGYQTAPDHPLGDFPAFKWQQLAPALARDLTGRRVLDVGCNAGFYSFELARRGARVLGVDTDERYLAQARWARSLYGLDDVVQLRRAHVYELARVSGRYDLILFLGVLYHLRYPLLALDILARLMDGLLVVQTLTMPGREDLETPSDLDIGDREMLLAPGWPKAAFLERRLAGDPTNWWAPDHACVEAMLRSCGLEVVERPGDELYVCRPAPGGEEARARNAPELGAATGALSAGLAARLPRGAP